MNKNVDQDTVDERIQNFIASKSPRKTLSESIADWLLQAQVQGTPVKGVSYEPLRWMRGRPAR